MMDAGVLMWITWRHAAICATDITLFVPLMFALQVRPCGALGIATAYARH
jgi:hypothetical protein